MLKVIGLLVFGASLTLAGEAWSRVMAYSACAASAADFATTMSSTTLFEANPLLRTATGRPSAWKLSAVKGASCGLVLYLAYKRHNRLMTALSLPQIAVFTRATVHNIQLDQKR